MIALSILHNVFITPEDIQKLKNKEDVTVVGCSVPVWYSRGTTSEPAEEVFCRYKLTTKSELLPVRIMKTGYHINIPAWPEDYKEPDMPVEVWKKLSEREREVWMHENQVPPSLKRLLPIEEGGNNKLLFKEIQGDRVKKDIIIHVIELKTMDYLESTISF